LLQSEPPRAAVTKAVGSPRLPAGPSYGPTLQTLGWLARPIPLLERCRRTFGTRFTLRLHGYAPFVILSDPDEARELFSAPPDTVRAGAAARVLEPLVGRRSVMLLERDEHLAARKLTLGAFRSERMERIELIMRDIAERECAAWPRDEKVALHPRLQHLTLEIILRVVFGTAEEPEISALRVALTRILEISAHPLASLPPVRMFVEPFRRLATLAPARHGGRSDRDELPRIGQSGMLGTLAELPRFASLQAQINRLIFAVIEQRRNAPGGQDVLSMLLDARQEDGTPLADNVIRDQLMTLVVAGHETTASELAWAFEALTQNPAVRQRLLTEIDRGGGDEYLDATVCEVLRRRPVLPIGAMRLTTRPLALGGMTLPGRVLIGPSSYLIHHDPAIYPRPYEFQPERFVGRLPGTYTWLPFGGGRRRCIGAGFAHLEMKTVLRTLLAENDVRATSSTAELTRRRAVTVAPRRGAELIIRPRVAASTG
jgi:cytochrome P450